MMSFRNGFIVIALVLVSAVGVLAQGRSGEHVRGRLLVQPAPGVDDAGAQQLIRMAGGKIDHKIDQINVSVLAVPEEALDAVTQALQMTGRFTFVEPDFVAHGGATPNDPDFGSQWHLSKIQAPSAWNISLGSATVPIAIIDSGADPTHPDLASKLLPGWNFLTGTSNTADTGSNGGHGTAVSGAAAAATNNLTGVAGVGWQNQILPLVVLNSSNTRRTRILRAPLTTPQIMGSALSVSVSGAAPLPARSRAPLIMPGAKVP